MKDALEKMESKMSPEAIRKAQLLAEQEILSIKLAQLREELNIKQTEFSNFRQPSVSKIERRKDMKISTLIEYLDSIGMGVEIKAVSRHSKPVKEKVLLKI